MKFESLNSSVSLIANVGVVVGLVFLAYEIKQNTDALEQTQVVTMADVYQERAVTRIDAHRWLADSENLAPIVARMEQMGWPSNLDALSKLDPTELFRVRQWQQSALVRLDNNYYQYRKGFLPESLWSRTKHVISMWGPTWKHLGIHTTTTKEFRKEVEAILGE